MNRQELLRIQNKKELPKILEYYSSDPRDEPDFHAEPLVRYLEALEERVRQLEDRDLRHVHSIFKPDGFGA